MREELHITGLVVHAAPARLPAITAAIAAIPGAQVHASAPNGKIVVTLEASTSADMMSKVSDIQHTQGVFTAGLVYECVDSLEAMNQEMPNAHQPA